MALTYQQEHREITQRPLDWETRQSCERWSPLQSTLFVIVTSSVLWLAIILSLVFSF